MYLTYTALILLAIKHCVLHSGFLKNIPTSKKCILSSLALAVFQHQMQSSKIIKYYRSMHKIIIALAIALLVEDARSF